MSTVVTTNPSAPAAVKIFGRQPALWVGLIEALIISVSYFHVGLTPETAGLANALVVAVGGAYVAWATKETNLSVYFATAKAALALAVGLGLHLSPEQQAVLMTLASTVLGFVNMTQNTPVAFPAVPDGTQAIAGMPYDVLTAEAALSAAADAGVYTPGSTPTTPTTAVAVAPETGGSVDGAPVPEVYEVPEADQVGPSSSVVDPFTTPVASPAQPGYSVDPGSDAVDAAQPKNDGDQNA